MAWATSAIFTLLAALPIAAILILMLWRQWSAAKAGGLGLAIALVAALGPFGFGREVYAGIGSLRASLGVAAEASWMAATILWIIFPALCIHHLQLTSGAIDVLRRFMGRLSADPRIIVLLIAWFFALFVEGAAGFGTTVALAAPFLVGVGFKPVEAVTAPMIGHVVGVSFGAVGTPIVPQIAATGAQVLELARVNAIYHLVLGTVLLFMMMRITLSRMRVREPGVLEPGVRDPGGAMPTGWIALAAGCFLLPYFVIAWWVGPELPSIGGAVLGGIAFVAVVRWRRPVVAAGSMGQGGAEPRDQNEAGEDELDAHHLGLVARAGSPYLILIALILLTRLIGPVRESLSGYAWDWVLLDHFKGTFRPLYHPGTMLMLAFLLGAFCQGSQAGIGKAMVKAAMQLRMVTLALLAMLALSRLMVHATMIDNLAVAAARMAGPVWPVASPFIGVLGTFVTGSATASNILFGDFQHLTASNLKLPPLVMAGAQGFGAAVGNMVCPHNIIAGCATVGIAGQEGSILRQTVWPCVIYATLGGVLAFVLSWIGWG